MGSSVSCTVYRPRPHRCLLSSFIAFLLLTVELNPGPLTHVRFGSFNARSAIRKGAAIQDIIQDNGLDVLAVCESWIRDDAPDAIKVDMAPSNYSVLHTHRPRRNGGGLALIYCNTMSARFVKSRFVPTAFELQLVGLQVGNNLVKIANIYRPPSASKSLFLDEFSELLTSISLGLDERLVVCGDFNLPGISATCVDSELQSLLDTHGCRQHVTSPNRYDVSRRIASLLDLVITCQQPAMQSLVSNVDVISSHGLSDHRVVICDLSVRRVKAPALYYTYRNIKAIDANDFERRLRLSSIVINPPDTPDEFVAEMNSCITHILDEIAPLRRGTRPNGRKAARWLSPEAVAAKRRRRRLERRWKKTG